MNAAPGLILYIASQDCDEQQGRMPPLYDSGKRSNCGYRPYMVSLLFRFGLQFSCRKIGSPSQDMIKSPLRLECTGVAGYLAAPQCVEGPFATNQSGISASKNCMWYTNTDISDKRLHISDQLLNQF